MIGVADVNGFVSSACETYRRDHLSDEGAAGTVTVEIFEEWVEKSLCPVLGNYNAGEPRSVVLLDNASTHMSPRVRNLIEERGSTLLYTAPYSSDF